MTVPAIPTPNRQHKQETTMSAGTWWRLRDNADPLIQSYEDTPPDHGFIFLLKEVRIIDEEIHSLEIHQHPLLSHHTKEFLYKEFTNRFALEPQGDSLRQIEQQTVMQTMAQHSQEITDINTSPPKPAIESAGDSSLAQKLHTLPTALKGEKSTQVAQAAQNALEQAKAKSEALSVITQKMEASARLMTRYQQEQVASITAKVSKETQAANETLEKLHTLTLFLGEHQTITQLKNGKSAPENETLHFYQRMLFLDEEFAVHFLDEPFHWKDANNLETLFAHHPDVVTRLLPQPRSVVIARIRRHARSLPESPNYAEIFQHIEESKWDQALVILVRDGERLFMIEADEDTANAQRLFPSRKEIDDLYKSGWRKDTPITPEDLAYSKSRSEHEQRGLFYKRFLVLFWGLHARKGLFGPFMDTQANWFDPQTQAQYFTFVHDEELGLDAPGPSLMDWIAQGHKTLKAGDLVVVDTKHAIDPQSCPAAYHHDHKVMNGFPRTALAIVEQDGPDLYIRASMKRDWGNETPKRQKIYLKNKDVSYTPEGIIVISHASSQLLTTFIDSRRDRVHYERTMPALALARQIIRTFEEEETSLQGSLHAIRLTRAHLKWKPFTDRTLKRAQTLCQKYEKQLSSGQPGLVTAKGLIPVKKWQHPVITLPTPWYCANEQTLTSKTPIGADTHLLNITLDTVTPFDGLYAPGFKDVVEAIANPQNTGLHVFDDISALDAMGKALYDRTYNGKGKLVIRHDICWPVGFATMPGWKSQNPETLLLTLRADPYVRLWHKGEKETAESWIRKLYGKPQNHIQALAEKSPLTLEAKLIKPHTRMDQLPTDPFIDWDNTWSGHGNLLAQPNERDVFTQQGKRLLSSVHSQHISIFQVGEKDWTQTRKDIKAWLDEGTVYLRKDIPSFLKEYNIDFKDIIFI